QRCLAA
ncbi:methylmalonate-semialdehyde dehydrogenase, partial [Vibrio parahaemolyticus V-223/04]